PWTALRLSFRRRYAESDRTFDEWRIVENLRSLTRAKYMPTGSKLSDAQHNSARRIVRNLGTRCLSYSTLYCALLAMLAPKNTPSCSIRRFSSEWNDAGRFGDANNSRERACRGNGRGRGRYQPTEVASNVPIRVCPSGSVKTARLAPS